MDTPRPDCGTSSLPSILRLLEAMECDFRRIVEQALRGRVRLSAQH
jgi:hypothetical protein